MQPGPVFVVEVVALIDREQLDDGTLGQVDRLVEHEAAGSYDCTQRVGRRPDSVVEQVVVKDAG